MFDSYNGLDYEHFNSGGIRFGRGSPDKCNFKLAREKPSQLPQCKLATLKCKVCDKLFKQSTPRDKTCKFCTSKSCRFCNGELTKDTYRFCNKQCYVDWVRSKSSRSCKKCGQKTTTRHQRYCDPCRKQQTLTYLAAFNFKRSKKAGLVRACKQCGDEFRVRQVSATNMFCNQKCYGKWKVGIKVTLFDRACVGCGTTFTPRRGTSKFCSHKCFSKKLCKVPPP